MTDSRNLKERLSDYTYVKRWFDQAGLEAVTEIMRLEVTLEAKDAEIKRLREALEGIVELEENWGLFGGETYQDKVDRIWDAARTALTPEGKAS